MLISNDINNNNEWMLKLWRKLFSFIFFSLVMNKMKRIITTITLSWWWWRCNKSEQWILQQYVCSHYTIQWRWIFSLFFCSYTKLLFTDWIKRPSKLYYAHTNTRPNSAENILNASRIYFFSMFFTTIANERERKIEKRPKIICGRQIWKAKKHTVRIEYMNNAVVNGTVFLVMRARVLVSLQFVPLLFMFDDWKQQCFRNASSSSFSISFSFTYTHTNTYFSVFSSFCVSW